MRILGISNPNFTGVTVATKAVTTDYFPVPHIEVEARARNIGEQILRWRPDILIVGGWSRGYGALLAALGKGRSFPVVSVYHSTPFHGNYFGDDIYVRDIELAQRRGDITIRAFVQPHTVAYYQQVKKENVAWVPHYFEMPARKATKKPPSKFRIGVLGGTSSWFKNGYGALSVAKDYAELNAGAEVVYNQSYDKPHHQFLELLSSCSVLIHTSHLECYPNIVQEAWGRGVPVILSDASVGLTESPLMSIADRKLISKMVVRCNIDPMELYQKIAEARADYAKWSGEVRGVHTRLTQKAKEYVDDVFRGIVAGYDLRRFDASKFRVVLPEPL